MHSDTADIDECALSELDLGLCTNGQCRDTDGSYECSCNEGFKTSTGIDCIGKCM